MVTKGMPTYLGSPMSSSPSSRLIANKRRKSNYSVASSIRKENLGIYWPEHNGKRGKCEKKKNLGPQRVKNVCKSNIKYERKVDEIEKDDASVYSIIMNDCNIKMQVDTGIQVTIIPRNFWELMS